MSTLTRITALFVTIYLGLFSEVDGAETDFLRFFPDDVIPKPALQAFLESGAIAEYRIVTVDIDSLREMIRNTAVPTGAQSSTILFPLLDESIVLIQIQAAGEHHDGWQSGFAQIMGKVAGDEYSMFQALFAPDGSANLTIRAGGVRYAIRKSSVLPYHFYYTIDWDTAQQKID